MPDPCRDACSFVDALEQSRVIAGHPDTLERLRAACDPETLRDVRLVPLPLLERERLLTGELLAEAVRQQDRASSVRPDAFASRVAWSQPPPSPFAPATFEEDQP